MTNRRALLACGILSSLVYVAANVAGALSYPGYSSTAQTISELSAIGAPSRPIWVVLGAAYNVLLVAFCLGLWASAGARRSLRAVTILLLAIAVIGTFWPPMHVRGEATTLTDTLHVVFAGVVSMLIMASIAVGAVALGKRFRVYSIATLAVLLAAGVMTARLGPAVAANAPTPWIGVYERIDLAGYLLWVAVLAIALLRETAQYVRAMPAPTFAPVREASGAKSA